MITTKKFILSICVLLCAYSSAQADLISVCFSFDLTSAIAPLQVGDPIHGILTYDDSTALVGSTFPGAIDSLELTIGGVTDTFAGSAFVLNDIGGGGVGGSAPGYFVASFAGIPSALPVDLVNFGFGFPANALPGSFDAVDLTTFADIFPNTFTFQLTHAGDLVNISEGTGVAKIVPESSAFVLSLLGMLAVVPVMRNRRNA